MLVQHVLVRIRAWERAISRESANAAIADPVGHSLRLMMAGGDG
jgi:hypothetical protein